MSGDISSPRARGAALERPFYFALVIWGDRYRHYLLNYCLPSLLSPGNLPALSTRQRSKFLIATCREDWAEMKDAPIFESMRRYVELVFVEIPPCPPGKSGCEHMGIGHKLTCEIAWQNQAYSVLLTPDCMLSDGTIARLQDLARQGYELALTAALRFGEEPFLGHLEAIGAIPNGGSRNGQPLNISAREMVFAAINGLHSETLGYEWDSPNFAAIPAAAWWRVPGQHGIVIHSLSWAPLLFDYAAVKHHDTSTLDNWTIDADYTHKNLGNSKSIYVIRDSDEAFIASWASLADKAVPVQSDLASKRGFRQRVNRAVRFRNAFYSSLYDPLKRRMFLQPIRWHAFALNGNWDPVERYARGCLARSINMDGGPNMRSTMSIAEKFLANWDSVSATLVSVTDRAAIKLFTARNILLHDFNIARDIILIRASGRAQAPFAQTQPLMSFCGNALVTSSTLLMILISPVIVAFQLNHILTRHKLWSQTWYSIDRIPNDRGGRVTNAISRFHVLAPPQGLERVALGAVNIVVNTLAMPFRIAKTCQILWRGRRMVASRLSLALHGDLEARQRINWRVQSVALYLVGHSSWPIR